MIKIHDEYFNWKFFRHLFFHPSFGRWAHELFFVRKLFALKFTFTVALFFYCYYHCRGFFLNCIKTCIKMLIKIKSKIAAVLLFTVFFSWTMIRSVVCVLFYIKHERKKGGDKKATISAYVCMWCTLFCDFF